MAVVQISRIQIRRGKSKVGTGFPQLASGELAWALDTQELYIGNGSVAEGAPAVGNTKILTEKDLSVNGNLLSLIFYIYKSNDTSIQTGSSPNSPITRPVLERLDDHPNTRAFGAVGDYNLTVNDGVVTGTGTDDTAALQRAIYQLFLNQQSISNNDDADGVRSRVVLEIPAGRYHITDTIYIPSYTTLCGAGRDKTIIYYTGNGPAFQCVNDNSTPTQPADPNGTIGIKQPRHITIKDMTIKVASGIDTALQLDAVKDSIFENLKLDGSWIPGESLLDPTSIGIRMFAPSTLVTCERNVFSNVFIVNFRYAVDAKYDIINNIFKDGYVSNVQRGFNFGSGASGQTGSGQQFGPRNTIIESTVFDNVKQQAVLTGEYSYNNTVKDCKFINVGNDGGGLTYSSYPQVYFQKLGNIYENNQSDRTSGDTSLRTLIDPPYELFTVPFKPELAGRGTYTNYTKREKELTYTLTPQLCVRLPSPTDFAGIPTGKATYEFYYRFTSNANGYTREGMIKLIANADTNLIHIGEEYDFSGGTENLQSSLEFSAVFLTAAGTIYTGAPATAPQSLAIRYKFSVSNDAGTLVYYFKASY